MRSSSAFGGLILVCVSLALAAEAQQAPTFVHKKKYIMGTVYEIVAYDASPEHASGAIDKALEEIARLDGVMSNYKPESDLSRLNRNGHFQPETVSPDLYQAIRDSLEYSRVSDGKFDITVAPLVDLWKAALGGDRVPSAEEQEKLRECVGYQKIQLQPPDRVRFHSSCMRIDLGSIGKGYAVDRAADILRSDGITSALINAGESTIYGVGAPPGQPAWLVHLRDPSNQIDPKVWLCDNSVSTSEQTPPSLLGNDSANARLDQAGRRSVHDFFRGHADLFAQVGHGLLPALIVDQIGYVFPDDQFPGVGVFGRRGLTVKRLETVDQLWQRHGLLA